MAVIDPANLLFYLSGGAGNADPNASLGGARSSTLLGSGLHNLFDPVSGDDAAAGDTEYRCVYFRNEDPNANGLLAPAKLWVSSLTSSADTEIAIGFDAAGKNGVATTVVDENTPPVGVSFSTPTSKPTGLDLPGAPYMEDDQVALWVRRTVNTGAAATESDAGSLRVEGDTV